MTTKDKVRTIWPFAYARQDAITNKWYIRKGHKRIIFDAPTEEAAWKELWKWITDVARRFIR